MTTKHKSSFASISVDDVEKVIAAGGPDMTGKEFADRLLGKLFNAQAGADSNPCPGGDKHQGRGEPRTRREGARSLPGSGKLPPESDVDA